MNARAVLATRNRHKVREIEALLAQAGVPVELVGIDELAPGVELREDEASFVGNAVAKARQAAAATGLPALADDSGLEVDALSGAPGVRSARYAGEPSDDQRNNAALLAALEGVPPERRTARFRCAAVWVSADASAGDTLVAEGTCEGVIRQQPQGTLGFGYDPLFWLPSLGKTMAELTLDEKNQLSHRAAAFRELAALLKAELSSP